MKASQKRTGSSNLRSFQLGPVEARYSPSDEDHPVLTTVRYAMCNGFCVYRTEERQIVQALEAR